MSVVVVVVDVVVSWQRQCVTKSKTRTKTVFIMFFGRVYFKNYKQNFKSKLNKVEN